MTDQMEKLFADLRAETLPTVRPPGTGPLRAAARRRRAAVSGAAAVAVLATAGLVAVGRPGDGSAPVAAPPSAPAPTSYSAELLAEEVEKGLDPTTQGLELGKVFTDTARGPLRARHELIGGTYELRLTCYGTGSMYVTAAVGGQPGQTPRVVEASLLCEAGAGRPYMPLDVVVPDPGGKLTLTIEPEVSGPGRAGVGYSLGLRQADKTRWQEAAGAALESDPDDQVSRGAQFLTDGGVGYENETIDPGRYRVRAKCLGFGTVRINIGQGQHGDPVGRFDETVLTCSTTDPQTASVTYTASKNLYYDVDPEADAMGRSAIATVLERY